MKRYIFPLFACLSFGIASSQEITDALRYSQENPTGTARFRAMGGAFGALGGDFSALNVNPAGSAIFANNQIAVSIDNSNVKNNSNYFGNKNSLTNNSLDLNQLGAVFVFKNYNPDDSWKKISFAINYENTNNFNNSIITSGINPNNSIANYFLSYANGVPLDVVYNAYYEDLSYNEQQAFLGYQTYMINPVDVNDLNNTKYTSNVTAGGNFYQKHTQISSGYNGKLSFNAASSYKDRLFIGVNLNSYSLDYTQTTSFYEDNNNTLGADATVNRSKFSNDLHTSGTGFSFQLGAILKATEQARFGLAYESPTWYHLSDDLFQKIYTVRSNTIGELKPDSFEPKYPTIYMPYRLQTQDKLTGSFAYIFGKSGLISVDYALKNYGSTQFLPATDLYYVDLNKDMKTKLNNTAELRVGGEYKIKEWSLRAGYKSETSPYRNATTIGDLTSYSGGLGYNFGGYKLDFAYSTSKRSSEQVFFSQGLTDAAKINTTRNNFVATLTIEF